MAKDPMAQFQIERMIPLEIGGLDASFSNASLFMVIAAGAATALMLYGIRNRALVPNRLQLAVEGTYNFVHDMLFNAAGADGVKKFFPLVFTLFIFIFMANMIGLVPGTFTPTSHIVVTSLMALLVFVTVIVVGFMKNGLGFLRLFAPSGVPPALYLIVTPIEVISFFSRPLSHAVRLWANIFAGHVLLKVFAGFVPMMAAAGGIGLLGSILPLGMTVALFALEFLVAFLQAYVFAMLTCIYLNDALHAGHH